MAALKEEGAYYSKPALPSLNSPPPSPPSDNAQPQPPNFPPPYNPSFVDLVLQGNILTQFSQTSHQLDQLQTFIFYHEKQICLLTKLQELDTQLASLCLPYGDGFSHIPL